MAETHIENGWIKVKRRTKDEWLTPPHIIKALGNFDLDPCAPINRPWEMASHHFTVNDNGLKQNWFGRVWMNPPFGADIYKWVEKLRKHGNGICLIPARVESAKFFENVWNSADGIFFFAGRLDFYNADGTRGMSGFGAPCCLVAYGVENVQAISSSKLKGILLDLNAAEHRVHLTASGAGGRGQNSLQSSFIADDPSAKHGGR